jgi:hypothetical protein
VESFAQEQGMEMRDAVESLESLFVEESNCCIYKTIDRMQCRGILKKAKPMVKQRSSRSMTILLSTLVILMGILKDWMDSCRELEQSLFVYAYSS